MKKKMLLSEFKDAKQVKRQNRKALAHIRNLESNQPRYSGHQIGPGATLQLYGLHFHNSSGKTVYIRLDELTIQGDK